MKRAQNGYADEPVTPVDDGYGAQTAATTGELDFLMFFCSSAEEISHVQYYLTFQVPRRPMER